MTLLIIEKLIQIRSSLVSITLDNYFCKRTAHTLIVVDVDELISWRDLIGLKFLRESSFFQLKSRQAKAATKYDA